MSLPLFCTDVFKQVHAHREANALLKALVNPKGSSKDCSFSEFLRNQMECFQ